MKKNLFLSLSVLLLIGGSSAQVYTPVTTTGYTLDAVAENTTALSTTGGALDGSNYVLYSAAYGSIYGGSATGLPNNGLIANGTRTYQLQSYTGNNVLYVPAGMSDSLTFTSPAPFPGLSILAFATEGAATMNLKIRFTDGSTQSVTAVSLGDWFTGTNTVVTGFDRCSRTSGAPAYVGPAGNPRMFFVDVNITCANSIKSVERIVFQNTSAVNPRLCIMAVSGALAPTFSATSSPVTCAGGTNGSATVTVSNGVPPFTYTWPGQPAQNSNIGTVLPPGNVSYTVTDASTCTFVSNVTISQALVPTDPITINASELQVCSGYSVLLTTQGASTYTWSNMDNTFSTTVQPLTNTLYSVVATTSDNCTVTGSITINTTPLPITIFTVVPPYVCINAQPIPLSATPGGGTFAGTSVIFNNFYPNQAGIGTHTVSYSYTDQNNCTAVNILTTTVSSPTAVIAFTITPASVCVGAPAFSLNAQPAGGTYTGSAVSPGGLFTPSLAGVGTRTVSYSYTDGGNCKTTTLSSVVVTTCSSVGINELLSGFSFEIYPNPASHIVTVKVEKDLDVSIVNEIGQVVNSFKLTSETENLISVAHLPAGIYFLTSYDGRIKHKLLIAK